MEFLQWDQQFVAIIFFIRMHEHKHLDIDEHACQRGSANGDSRDYWFKSVGHMHGLASSWLLNWMLAHTVHM